MMQDIRAIRQTPPGPGSGLSDRELLEGAYTFITNGLVTGKLIYG